MKNNKTKAVVGPYNLADAFTQLFRNEKPFGHQQNKFAETFSQYSYIAELFTNVKLRQGQIVDYVKSLSEVFRKIINADVRYRQRSADLPACCGVRAFGVTPLGGGWYSPNIKVATNSAVVLEYICRQWCKRTNQYPRRLQAQFVSPAKAKQAMPFIASLQSYNSIYGANHNLDIYRKGHIIEEEYHISQPFRLEYYISFPSIVSVEFGYACRLYRTESVKFDNLNNMCADMPQFRNVINDCFSIDRFRSIQSWGHIGKESKKPPKLKKERKVYGHNTDKMASLYYRACRAGYVTFNAYVYGRLKAGAKI